MEVAGQDRMRDRPSDLLERSRPGSLWGCPAVLPRELQEPATKQLVTVLLDGDTSQTALSVSGRAAGTLISRHTDNRDKAGVWWLEYGRTDPGTGQTEYLTTGLWLRSTGQSLLRAFFVTPGRVDHQLILHVERSPISIERLAEQLAAARGEMFTDAPRL
jgi:hypothetical protein